MVIHVLKYNALSVALTYPRRKKNSKEKNFIFHLDMSLKKSNKPSSLSYFSVTTIFVLIEGHC